MEDNSLSTSDLKSLSQLEEEDIALKLEDYDEIKRRLSMTLNEQIVQSPIAKNISTMKLTRTKSETKESVNKKVLVENEKKYLLTRTDQKENISPRSFSPQDVHLQPAVSIPFSFGIRSPGKLSPLRGRNMKEYEEQVENLKKENFSLKLRIYFLEEKIGYKGIKGDGEELHKANIELKVETEALKKQLCDKQELLRQAASLVTNMENQFRDQLQAIQKTHEQESEHLRGTIEVLKKDLEKYCEKTQKEGRDLIQLCVQDYNNLTESHDQNLIDLERPLNSDPLMSSNRLQGVYSIQDPFESELKEQSLHAMKPLLKEAPEIIPKDSQNRIEELEEEVERLTAKIKDLQETLHENERTSKALEDDIVNLKKEIEDRDEKVSDIEFVVIEKDQKIDHLIQDLETKCLEIKAKNMTIQTLHEDLKKVEPQIEVKVQEIIEKDRIIEEKTEQLLQQNKILVEIQITLDEKQKQISELEESLTTAKQKIENLNHDFKVSLLTIMEMFEQIKTKNKEIVQLQIEVKRQEKTVEDLMAELREALDMVKKGRWKVETSDSQNLVNEIAKENERLWAEFEKQFKEIGQLREQKEGIMKEMNEKEALYQKEKHELEDKVKELQNKIGSETNDEAHHYKEINSRESLLKSQESIVESLKCELSKAKEELSEKKEEISNIRNKAEALKRSREILTEKVSDQQTLNEHLANDSSLDNVKAPKLDGQSSQTEEFDSRKIMQLCLDQINTLKEGYKDVKQEISLKVLQVATSRYQKSLRNYKEEIISLRKRLSYSHNSCSLLKNRLEELSDFIEQILDMDKNGTINLKHLSDMQKSSIRKSLNDSRSLSHSVSQSFMMGMDSVLNETVASQSDAEASRLSLLPDTFAEEFELTHHVDLTLPNDTFNYSELEPTKDFTYYSFASKIHSQINEKDKELDALAIKLNELVSVLKNKDEGNDAKTLRIIALENQNAKLKDEISFKNRLSVQSSFTSGSYGTVVEQKYLFDMRNDSSLHLSALDYSPKSPEMESKITKEIFLKPQRERSCSDILPPRQSYISSSDGHAVPFSGDRFSSVSDKVKTCTTSEKNTNVYSIDAFKNISNHDKGSKDLKNAHRNHKSQSMSRINFEQPSLTPSLVLASPSESEAWSEPDRSVSLARIGLDTCNILSLSNDRSCLTKSASESEGETNSDEAKECSVGLRTSVTKRRSDASEIKKLTNKLENLEQVNQILKAELLVYHQTLYQQSPSISSGNCNQVSITSLDISVNENNLKNNYENLMDTEQIDEKKSGVLIIPSPLFKDIRSLRTKLEESITKNELLQDQLEAALSGYLSEETKTLNIRHVSLQQELKDNQEKLIIAYNTEQQLRLHIKQNESKMFELGERLADYITTNQKLENDICKLTKELHNSKEKLDKTEKELEDSRIQTAKSISSSKEFSDSQFRQMETYINAQKSELKMIQESEKEKELKIEQQLKYIQGLEEANKDYELKLQEQESSLKKLYQSITLLQEETSKSSMSNHLITKLKDLLQEKETQILEITNEKFDLMKEKSSFQSQIAFYSKSIADSESLQLSYNNLQKEFISLENTHKRVLFEKNELESMVKEAENKEKEFKATIKEREVKIEDILSQLDAERHLTKSLQIQIKKIQLTSENFNGNATDEVCGFTNSISVHSGSKTSLDKVGKDNTTVLEWSLPIDLTWNRDKENRFSRYSNQSQGSHSLPIIHDYATSNDSPDLGIGSDGQFSSREQLSISGGQRAERCKFKSDVPEKENILQRMCTEPSHSHLLSDIQQLRKEKDDLYSELTSTKENLNDALSQIAKANHKNESIEKEMIKQLSKNYDVLQKTKANLVQAKKYRKPLKQNPSSSQDEKKPQTG